MKSPVQTRPTEAAVSTCERLRGSCLEARHCLAGELGLNIFLRHGMLAWTRTGQPALGTSRPLGAPVDTARVPAPLHEDIIHVMATMATNLSRSAHSGALRA